MVKELKTVPDDVQCDVCGRTILRGERPEHYLAPGGSRRLVCELCRARAEHEGWIRESAAGDMPVAQRNRDQRRSLLGRLRRRPRADDGEPVAGGHDDGPDGFDDAPAWWDDDDGAERPPPEPEPERRAQRPRRETRHVRAVPTNAEVKIERALELFNSTDFPRKVAGIARSLGAPWVSATPDAASPSEVVVVVAWELSWYRYRIDLGDAEEPVALVAKGLELEEIDESLREWNASADGDGRLAIGVGSGS